MAVAAALVLAAALLAGGILVGTDVTSSGGDDDGFEVILDEEGFLEPGAENLHAFSAIEGYEYRFTVEVEGPDSAFTLPRATMNLLNADGVEQLDNISVGSPGETAAWEATSTGTFSVRVTGPQSNVTGSYRLIIECRPDDHPDERPGTPISPGDSLPGLLWFTLPNIGDSDVFTFNAVAGQKYEIELEGAQIDNTLSLPRGFMEVYQDPSDTAIDDGNLDRPIVFTAQASGEHSILVRGAQASAEGTYILHLNVLGGLVCVTLSVNAGGQFVFWNLGPGFGATDGFTALKIAWLFNSAALSWTSFIPALGTTNYALVDGAVLWLVSLTAQDLQFCREA